MLTPQLHIKTAKAGMLSYSDCCRAFDSQADGIVLGEGVGVLVLKPLKAAMKDRDPIWGIIKGSGVNQDGHSNGITAPNLEAQLTLEKAIYQKFDIDPSNISYVEAHGTGTPLGDPIEMSALSKAFGDFTDKKHFCAIGSVKSNIGHTIMAAGVASVIKVLLSLKHNQLVPSINFVEPNKHIDFTNSPFYVNTELKTWERINNKPRLAAVSSFGFSGTNVHVVIEEAPQYELPVHQAKPYYLVTLSAKHMDSLRQRKEDLLRYLERYKNTSIEAISYTLNVGRNHFNYRCALVVSSREDLQTKLELSLMDQKPDGYFQGEESKESADKASMENELKKIATNLKDQIHQTTDDYRKHLESLGNLYVKGYELDWDSLHQGEAQQLISLPTYPFLKKRYWYNSYIQKTKDYIATPPAAVSEKLPSKLNLSTFSMSDAGSLQTREVISHLKDILKRTLYLDESDELDLEKPFSEIGLDSISGVELIKHINENFKLDISAAKLYDYSTLTSLSEYIACLLSTEKKPENSMVKPLPSNTHKLHLQPVNKESGSPSFSREITETREAIAIIGIAASLPGARTLEAYWDNLRSGRCSVGEIPPERWQIETYYSPDIELPGKSYSKWGGFVENVDLFDPLFFNISPSEAEWMDPQQRLLLEISWQALEDAGYAQHQLNGTRCGVYVGVLNNDYAELIQRIGGMTTAQPMLGNSPSILAARVSYLLNLKGPAITLDTACSSSLVAIHMARQSLLTGEVDLMLAGGVTLYLTETPYIQMSKAAMLSPEGLCKTFDERADGFVPGEGCGVVVLKRLSDALRDNDRIYGIIRGSGINQDGKTNGITAPSSESQKALELSVYHQNNINPETISYVEAHGTGTKLGDPIEVEALTEAFRNYTDKKNYCALGSVKSNIGHTSAAAGVASLIKVLLCLKHKQLVPTLHFNNPNQHIDFANSPFYVNTELKDWETVDQKPRLAAINSFGFSGTNAHLVVEEPPQQMLSLQLEKPCYLITLSAKSIESLKQRQADLRTWLKQHSDLSLTALVYTLNTGRSHFNHRCALVVSSFKELKGKLDQLKKNRTPSGYFQGDVNKEPEDRAIYERVLKITLKELKEETYQDINDYRKQLEALGNLYVKGYDLDWQLLHQGEAKQKLSGLPTYPFQRQRYWVPQVEKLNSPVFHGAFSNNSNPLLGWNTSTFTEQSFTVYITLSDFYVRDHKITGRSLLPAAALLEMVHAASQSAAGKPLTAIRHSHWLQPIWLESTNKGVKILLYPQGDNSASYEIITERNDERLLHASGEIIYSPIIQPQPTIKLSELESQLNQYYEKNRIYAYFSAMGLDYGSTFQTLQWLKTNGEIVLAYYQLPDELHHDVNKFNWHPSILDAALQSVIGFVLHETTQTTMLPFSVSQVIPIKTLPKQGYIQTIKNSAMNSEKIQYDVLLFDNDGILCLEIKDFICKVLNTSVYTINQQSAVKHKEKPLLCYYQPQWQTAELQLQKDLVINTVVVFADDLNIINAFRDASAYKVIGIIAGKSFKQLDQDNYCLALTNFSDYRQWFEALRAKQLTISHIIWARNLTESNYELTLEKLTDYLTLECQAGVLLVQELLQTKLTAFTWTVVYNYQVTQLMPALLWNGFNKTLAQEHPNVRTQLIGVDSSLATESWITQVIAELAAKQQILHVRHRYAGTLRQIETYEPIEDKETVRQLPFKQQGIYLITGGLGGLGFIVARYLAKHYKARLILTGRRAIDASIKSQINELQQLGSEIVYSTGDVAQVNSCIKWIKQAKERWGSVQGIIHCAGKIHDGLLRQKSWSDYEQVLMPKILGAYALDYASRDEKLDCFLLFSSIASCLGNIGQADYASANSFLDSFAQWRSLQVQQGNRYGQTLSFNWPLWQEGGMKVNAATNEYMRENWGILPMPTDTGLAAFENGLTQKLVQLLVVYGYPLQLASWLQSSFATQEEIPLENTAFDQAVFLNDLKTSTAKIIKLSPDKLSLTQNLMDFGFDSLAFMELSNELRNRFGLKVTAALFFEYATLQQLGDYLAQKQKSALYKFYKLADSHKTSPKPVVQTETKNTRSESRFSRLALTPSREQDIAIIGMAGIFPGAADLNTFWQNLQDGKDCITEIPTTRWEAKSYKVGNVNVPPWGGFIEGIDQFDAGFFVISPREAELMDPQQRLFLQTVWKTVEDAGYAIEQLAESKTGLFVGVSTHDYLQLLQEANAIEAYATTGMAHSILANRVSYLLNLKGPSEAIDTACSSSLVALHHAIRSIQNNDCELAIVGGVNALLSPNPYVSFAHAGMLAPDGRCKTFDKSANGYVRGEGAGAILLKPLARALKDNDQIHGVIKASSVNHGGHVNTLTAPNPNAQAELIVDAYRRAGIHPETISYIETHGTGTALGDPIEVNGLKKAFQQLAETYQIKLPTGYCALGSVKANVGHLEAAAGIISVIKVLMMFKARELPPQVHFQEINPQIELEESPFYIVKQKQKWEVKESPRRAGISSFGFGGANAHVVLEEVAETRILPRDNKPYYLIALSAKHADSLQQRRQDLQNYLQQFPDRQLSSIAYTLNVGRSHFNQRCAFIVSSVNELMTMLEQVHTGQEPDSYIQDDGSKDNIANESIVQNMMEKLITTSASEKDEYRSQLVALGRLYVKGYNLNWQMLHQNEDHQKIQLPTYPFLKKRFWVATSEKIGGHKASLHPLLTCNVSNLKGQLYKTLLTGNEFYLVDHRVINGQKVLPGAAYLEMAHAAGELVHSGACINRLEDIIWSKPLIVDTSKEIMLRLELKNEKVSYTVYSLHENEEVIHSQGKLVYGERCKLSAWSTVAELNSLLNQHYDKEFLYKTLNKIGLQYGPSFQAIEWVKTNGHEVLAHYRLPPNLGNSDAYFIHPSLLDSALHVSVALYLARNSLDGAAIPFALSRLNLCHKLPDTGYIHVKQVNNTSLAIQIMDEHNRVCAELEGFQFRRIVNDAATAALGYYTPQWEILPIQKRDKGRDTFTSGICVISYSSSSNWINLLRGKYTNIPIIHLQVGASQHQYDSNTYQVGAGERKDYEWFLQTIQQQEIQLRYFIIEEAEENLAEDLLSYLDTVFRSLFELLQCLLKTKQADVIRFVLSYYYHNAAPRIIRQSMLSGLAKSLYQEQPRYQMLVVGLDRSVSKKIQLAQLCDELRYSADIQVRYHGKVRYVERYTALTKETTLADQSSASISFRPQGIYLITGGLGGIGLIVARYLAEHYQAKLILTGRSSLTDTKQNQLTELEGLGAEAVYLQGDVSDYATVETWVMKAKSHFGAIHGIINSAGIMEGHLLIQKDWSQFKQTQLPKVIGTINLDTATKDEKLDCFVLFSSIASILGNVGQTDYATANAFLDEFAVWRDNLCKQGLRHGKSLSINWPYWIEGGMRLDEASQRHFARIAGVLSLPSDKGLIALKESLTLPAAQSIVLYGYQDRISGMFSALQEPLQSDITTTISLTDVNNNELFKKTLASLKEMLALNLKIDIHELDDDVPFADYGIDSIMIVDVTRQLEELFGVLPKTLFFEYQTLTALSGYFVQNHAAILQKKFQAEQNQNLETTVSSVI